MQEVFQRMTAQSESSPEELASAGITDGPPEGGDEPTDRHEPEPAPPAAAAEPVPPAAPESIPEEASLAPPDPFSDAPTVPDPNATRPRRAPEQETAAPATSEATPEPEPTAYAPSVRKAVLTPRAWPPIAPAPSPREELIDQATAAAIGDYLTARGPRRELPADAEQVAEVILNLLQQCHSADQGYGILQAERVPSWKATPTACDLLIRQQADGEATLRTGVLVLTGNRATAIAGYLRRLTTEAQPFDRLFLISEERIGLPLGPRGLEYLQELQQRTSVQLHTLELSAADHAELSALRAVARQARGGTLSVDGDRLSEPAVIASHHRQQRYLASRFLSSILFDAPPTELLRIAPPVLTQ